METNEEILKVSVERTFQENETAVVRTKLFKHVEKPDF
jgi:hypothetical protein